MWAYTLVDLGRVPLDSAKHGRVIYIEPALFHHLFDVAVRERVPAVPADAEKDDSGLEVAPLERGLMILQEYDSGGLKGNQASRL